jgi:hypothetical protein
MLRDKEFNPAYLCRERIEVMLTSEVRYELADLSTFGVYSQISRFSIRAVSFGNEIYRENFLELEIPETSSPIL